MTQQIHLLSVAGLSPAVVTETMWLLRAQGCKFAGVTIVTTGAGARMAQAALLGPKGAIRRLCGSDTPFVELHVLSRNGAAMEDIRDMDDHQAMAAGIDSIVRRLVRTGRPALHASIAGGRKSMSAALSLAMSLHARSEDTMSHVLVTPALEADPEFMFPPQDCDPVHAGIWLANIPFVRVRNLLSREGRGLRYNQLVGHAQAQIDRAYPLTLDLAKRRLHAADEYLSLPPVLCALLALLAVAGNGGIFARGLDIPRLMSFYQRAGAAQSAAESLGKRLRKDEPDIWLREHVSRLRDALRPGNGTGIGMTVTIERTGRRPNSGYALRGTAIILENQRND